MHLSWLDPHKMRQMTVVGREKMAVFDDMELERKVTVYDSAAEPSLRQLRRVADADRGHLQPPKIPNAEPLRLECEHFLGLVRGEGDRLEAARAGLGVVRALEQLQASLEREHV